MSFIGEFRLNWVTLLAAFIGIATGNALSHYTMSLFAPELIREFGWSKAQFALVSALPIVTAFMTPLAGRFADKFGARMAAGVGMTAMSLGFFGLSTLNGNIYEFFAIWLVQHIFGVMATSLVFARTLVDRFDKARGTALSVLMMGPPLSGAVAAPILGAIIASYGWRNGFVALGAVSAIGGLVCIFFMGRSAKGKDQQAEIKNPKITRADFLALVRQPAFALLVGGMFMINIAQPFAASQLKLVVLSKGVSDSAGTWMVSLYATGVIVGRAIFGIALDRISANKVALFGLSLPAIGFTILGAPGMTVAMCAAGIMLIGIAQGAEGDIGGYLVSRHFNLMNFSLVFAFVKSGLDAGGAIGALILSFTLSYTGGSYEPYIWICAGTTLVGAFLFYLTGPDGNHRAPDALLETEAN
ncbi:MFS transporter [Novosphingobium sp. MW5]|nr:MFS transporter [Novosphingobium sp. MW5]